MGESGPGDGENLDVPVRAASARATLRVRAWGSAPPNVSRIFAGFSRNHALAPLEVTPQDGEGRSAVETLGGLAVLVHHRDHELGVAGHPLEVFEGVDEIDGDGAEAGERAQVGVFDEGQVVDHHRGSEVADRVDEGLEAARA